MKIHGKHNLCQSFSKSNLNEDKHKHIETLCGPVPQTNMSTPQLYQNTDLETVNRAALALCMNLNCINLQPYLHLQQPSVCASNKDRNRNIIHRSHAAP